MKKLIVLVLVPLLASAALAKLSAASDEAKAKAAETAAKTAWSGKVAAYDLCKSQDKVAATYRAQHKKAGPAASGLPACAAPAPFVYKPDTDAGTAAAPVKPAATAPAKK